MGDTILKDILIIFIFAIPAVIVAHRLKIPSIVGFLIAGLVIGPHGLRLIPDAENISTLAEVGVALLLFSIGLEFSFERFKGMRKSVALMGALQVAVTTALGFMVGMLSRLSATESLYLGFAASLSSTAIVLAILSHRRLFDAPSGRITAGILILQDIAVIPIMVILKLASTHVSNGLAAEVGIAALKLFALAFVMFALSKWILRPLLHYLSKPLSKELFVTVVVGLAIGSAYVTEKVGLSFALGAFLAGLLISSTDYRFQALSEISPFRYCFNGVFFVAVGMIVNPLFVLENMGSVTTMVAFFILAKILVVSSIIVLFGYPLSIAIVSGFMLAQVGEFSFLLAHFGQQAGVVRPELFQLIVSSAALTMIIAPLLVAISPVIGEKISSSKFSESPKRRRERAEVVTEDISDHAIICGFGPLGKTIGKLMDRHSIKYVILEMNPATVARERQHGRTIYLGDGASSALLNHSKIERARLLAIAVPDYMNAVAITSRAREMNPSIFIIARGRYRDQCPRLYDAGADIVICEELEAGIEMGRYVLSQLGMFKDDVRKIVDEIRSFGSADFF